MIEITIFTNISTESGWRDRRREKRNKKDLLAQAFGGGDGGGGRIFFFTLPAFIDKWTSLNTPILAIQLIYIEKKLNERRNERCVIRIYIARHYRMDFGFWILYRVNFFSIFFTTQNYETKKKKTTMMKKEKKWMEEKINSQ